jgi:23S rRNA (adenine2503-C2)-methyltransferase
MKLAGKCRSEDYAIKYALEVPVNLREPNGLTKSIEGAFIHLPYREDGKPKSILCLSSQVGCFYDCLMCANAGKTFFRCLTPKELNQQIELILMQDGNIRKIEEEKAVEYAFMGIGEPLWGMNVIQAIQQHKEFIPDTRFAVATVGAKGTIRRLADSRFRYPVRLELSLHFPNNALRNRWINSSYIRRTKDPVLNIEGMLDETEEFLDKKGGKATVNYMIIDRINNMQESLEELISLLNGRKERFYVKVMEPNHTSSLVESHKEDLDTERTYSMEEFKDELEKRGIHAVLFKSKGIDIRAGCGMMALRD